MNAYAEDIREKVLEEIDLTRDMSDAEVLGLIDEKICTGTKKYSLSKRRAARAEVFYSLRKLDVLQELIDDDDITEIMVNGFRDIFYERCGRLYRWDKGFSDKDKLEDTIQSIVAANNKLVNEANPIVDTRLSDGSRVNIVLSPISIDGSAITIRKFPKHPISMDDLISYGSVSAQVAGFLKLMVVSGYNIYLSGGTGSGKTTFLNALSEYIPETERIITIEDSAELQLKNIPNLVRLETRTVIGEGAESISIRDLIRSALRMRPNRIIVGECRGGEALDMLQAMNTGHDGSLSTGHANSCRDMISRLETMVLMGSKNLPVAAIRSQIASGVDLLVHLGRLRDKSRKVLDIAEIDGIEDGEVRLNNLFHFREAGELDGKICGNWEKVGELKHTEKLRQAGLSQVQI